MLRHVAGGNGAAAGLAQEGDWVPGPNFRNGRDVHQGLIHADSPHDGNAPAAKEYPAHTGAQRPGQAVGIADGEGGYTRLPVCGKIQAIACVFTGVQGSDGGDPGVERQHRPQLPAPAPGVIGGTQHPVQRHAHPGIVPAQIRDVQQPIAAQKVALARPDAPVLQLPEQPAEGFCLAGSEGPVPGNIRIIGTQMGEDSLYAKVLHGIDGANAL